MADNSLNSFVDAVNE